MKLLVTSEWHTIKVVFIFNAEFHCAVDAFMPLSSGVKWKCVHIMLTSVWG